MPRALLSVTDKTGIIEFAQNLVAQGYELLSTGGTAKALRDAGITVLDVSEVTGMPEMLDGRVKTLHPKVHGALLAETDKPEHLEALGTHGIVPIDLLAVNLYAFEKTVTTPHTWEEAVESIDIGGPAMIRAAAKNHARVTVVVDPADYTTAVGADAAARRQMAAKAFRHTAYYDSLVSRYLTIATNQDPLEAESLTLGFERQLQFRYGENPHQAGALYRDPLAPEGIAQARKLWGKELSYNNIADADGAWELVADLPPGACAIIKHGNPCGAAVGSDLGESYRMARASDTVSAFGGIAAFHGVVDRMAAAAMVEKGNFLEVVIAQEFTDEATAIFRERSGWGQDVRLLAAPLPDATPSLMVKSIRGGAVIQWVDEEPGNEWSFPTQVQPTPEQLLALRFLWAVVQHVKSNAIVVGTGDRLLGTGAGQMNRVQSVRLALEQAGDSARGASLASDAFFPFPDSVEAAARAGIAAIVQPGGSKKDHEVVAKADELGIAMAFTGVRHFRH